MKLLHRSKLSKKKIFEISNFHMKNIKGEFNLFGTEFFINFYETLSKNRESFFFLLEKNKKIEGFLIYTLSPVSFSKFYLKQNIFFFILFFFKSFKNPQVFFKFIKFLLFGYFLNKLKKKKNHPELLSIAISNKFRDKGFGNILINKFKKKLYFKNKKFSLVIFKNTKKLRNFYIKNKFSNTKLKVPFHNVAIYISKIF